MKPFRIQVTNQLTVKNVGFIKTHKYELYIYIGYAEIILLFNFD